MGLAQQFFQWVKNWTMEHGLTEDVCSIEHWHFSWAEPQEMFGDWNTSSKSVWISSAWESLSKIEGNLTTFFFFTFFFVSTFSWRCLLILGKCSPLHPLKGVTKYFCTLNWMSNKMLRQPYDDPFKLCPPILWHKYDVKTSPLLQRPLSEYTNKYTNRLIYGFQTPTLTNKVWLEDG